jgi:outer membrane protein insertion porin family
MGRLELEFPTSSGLKSVGLRPSAFIDIGSLWGLKTPILSDLPGTCTSADALVTKNLAPGQTKDDCTALTGANSTFAPGFKEFFFGNSPRPRLAIGIGVNWTSPFGPLRLDLAKAILTQKGDTPKLFTFNVGTQF